MRLQWGRVNCSTSTSLPWHKCSRIANELQEIHIKTRGWSKPRAESKSCVVNLLLISKRNEDIGTPWKHRNYWELFHFKSNQVLVQTDGLGNTGIFWIVVATHIPCLQDCLRWLDCGLTQRDSQVNCH